MYTIKLDNNILAKTENEIGAWVMYRSILRRGDLSKNEHVVTLEKNQAILRKDIITDKPAMDGIGVSISTNDIFTLIIENQNISPSALKVMLSKIGVEVSSSKVKGWYLPKSNRKHQSMLNDELYLIIKAIGESSDQRQ